MSATSPAVEPLLRVVAHGYRLPLLVWHLFVHLPVMLLLIAIDTMAGARSAMRRSAWWARACCGCSACACAGVGTPLPGGTMFVANHLGWIDIVALHSQHMMGLIAKAEIRGWPLIGWLARARAKASSCSAATPIRWRR